MNNKNKLPVVVVIGANGFVGKNLVEALLETGNIKLISLERRVSLEKYSSKIKSIQGDLTKLETLQNLLVEGCTVVNLAYSFNMSSEANLLATKNLAEICRSAKIKKLIHCSTVAVFGRNSESIVNETSKCKPTSEYGLTKLSIEKILHNASRDNFEFINLRPTSVFGPDGQPLSKLIRQLSHGSMILNYLRSCLFNKRKLNLVGVDVVVSAIIFMMNDHLGVDGETFIVSQDYESINNFHYVENYLLKSLLHKNYPIKPFDIPLNFLSFILKVAGRDACDPLKIFDSRKIMKLGFRTTRTFKQSLESFVEFQKSEPKD
jgi:nucleoside-diphosphate-sugar epimerase